MEQCAAIKFCFKLGKSVIEMLSLLEEVCGVADMFCLCVLEWYLRFKNEWESLKDAFKRGD